MRFLKAVPWPIALAVVCLLCVPLALRQSQRWVDARRSAQPFEDEVSAVHLAFTSEWQSLRLDVQDEQERQQMRTEWRDRYDSALREVYQRHGRDTSVLHLAEPRLPLEEPVERPVLFRALTPRSALRALLSNSFRVELDSSEDTHDGWIIYDCKGDEESVLFTVWLREGSAVEDEMVVTGALKIIERAPSQINPNGFTEYRLIGESR
jgi:hypothetical protein